MASYAELIVDQGSDFNTILTLTDDNTNLPINVLGYSISANVKRSYYSVNNSAVFTTTINDAANGNVTISLSSSVTKDVKPGRYVYDVKVTSPSNSVTRIVEGILTLTPRVS
jgi:hypothetical protein